MAVAKNETCLSEAKILAATGKRPDEWFAILDAQQATGWTHTTIARWLAANHDALDGWWAQSVTVRYEQARGMRAPGQMADGTFTVGASRTVAADQQAALDAAIAAFSAHLEAQPAVVNRTARYPSARWRLPHGEAILVSANPTKDARTQVSAAHSRIASPERVALAKSELASAVERLATLLR